MESFGRLSLSSQVIETWCGFHRDEEEECWDFTRQEGQEERTRRGGQSGGKWQQLAAAFRMRPRTTVMGLLLRISRETPIGHRRAREEKIRKTGDKATTTAKSGGDRSDGSLCLTAAGPEHLTWGELSYSELRPRQSKFIHSCIIIVYVYWNGLYCGQGSLHN